MRIVCQKCSAAYAIDDKFVTPKGVRAQCPRCRNLQLVKKGDVAAAPTQEVTVPNPFLDQPPNELFDLSSPAAATSPGMPGPAQPEPPPANDARELMDFSELGMGSPAEPFGSPAGAPAPAHGPFGGPSATFGGAADFSAPPSPFGAEFTAPGSPFGGSAGFSPPQLAPPPSGFGNAPLPYAPSPAAPKPNANPFGSFGNDVFGQAGSQEALSPLNQNTATTEPVPTAETANAAGVIDARCKVCGKAIFDPFDQALEICDDCRNKPAGAGPSITTGPTQAMPAPVRRQSGETNAQTSGVMAPPEHYRMKSAMVAGAQPASKSPLFIALGVVVAIAAGGFVVWKRPWVKKPPPLAKKIDTPSAPIEAMVGEWRLRYPDLTGTAAEYVEQGDDQMARDSTQGYARAEEAYQRALVLDSRNDRAVAGWALALAFGRFGQIEERTGNAAEAMLASSELRSGDSRVYIAHAHLMLARGGNFNDIKVLAERGKSSASDKDKALAYLALGQAFLGKNQQFAAENFDKAAAADPKLKRAVLYQAQLMVQQGELKKAVDSLDKKLKADPDQWEAADMLARLYLEAGEPLKARKTYLLVPSAAKDPRAQMTLAVLAYQHEGQAAAAAKQLEAVLADEDSLDPQDVIVALGHLAAAKRVSGDLDGAAGAATRALDKRPGDLNALVQRFLISVERNKAGDARGQLQPLLGRLNDPAQEALFTGVVDLLEGRAPEALKLFVKAWETDKRHTDALMLAGAAAARAHVDGKAWEYALKEGLKADPWRAAPSPVMAPIYVRPIDVLRVARGSFEPLAREEEDPNPPLAEGLLAWFSDDLDAAGKLFDKVVHDDPNNGAGYAYKAFVALKKGQNVAAEDFANKGVKGDRAQPLAYLAQGMSLLALNKLEPAKKAVTKAAELAPSMLLPRAKLGEISGRQKRPDEARKVLTTVLLNDPLYREARRAQYLGGS